MTEFEKIVEVQPAFDRLAEGYGIGSCRIRFVLKGPKGAVQFLIGTDWYVPSAREHLANFPTSRLDLQRKPDGWDVGYHSPEPMYEGQGAMKCELMPGGECYYDGSSLRADEWVENFVAGGTSWLWPKLEEEYHSLFGRPESEAA